MPHRYFGVVEDTSAPRDRGEVSETRVFRLLERAHLVLLLLFLLVINYHIRIPVLMSVVIAVYNT